MRRRRQATSSMAQQWGCGRRDPGGGLLLGLLLALELRFADKLRAAVSWKLVPRGSVNFSQVVMPQEEAPFLLPRGQLRSPSAAFCRQWRLLAGVASPRCHGHLRAILDALGRGGVHSTCGRWRVTPGDQSPHRTGTSSRGRLRLVPAPPCAADRPGLCPLTALPVGPGWKVPSSHAVRAPARCGAPAVWQPPPETDSAGPASVALWVPSLTCQVPAGVRRRGLPRSCRQGPASPPPRSLRPVPHLGCVSCFCRVRGVSATRGAGTGCASPDG